MSEKSNRTYHGTRLNRFLRQRSFSLSSSLWWACWIVAWEVLWRVMLYRISQRTLISNRNRWRSCQSPCSWLVKILPSTRWLDSKLMTDSNRLCFRYTLLFPIPNQYRLTEDSRRPNSMGSPERRIWSEEHHSCQLHFLHPVHHGMRFGAELEIFFGISTSIRNFWEFSRCNCTWDSGRCISWSWN